MELLKTFARATWRLRGLFRQHRRKVYSWFVRIVRDSGLLRISPGNILLFNRARDRFQSGRQFRAWPRRIATNALSTIKEARREIGTPGDLAARGPGSQSRETIEQIQRLLPVVRKIPLVATLALIGRRTLRQDRGSSGIQALSRCACFEPACLRKKLHSLVAEVGAK